jgi:hypothetical protein
VSELILGLDLVGARHEPVKADISVQRNRVDFWCNDRRVGTADRWQLRQWLNSPEGVFDCEEMSWFWEGWHVGVRIKDVVPGYYLPANVVAGLRHHI